MKLECQYYRFRYDEDPLLGFMPLAAPPVANADHACRHIKRVLRL